MSSNPFFLISILISAILAFAIVTFLVEMILIVLKKFPKANTGRAHALLRSLPFISLFSDLIFSSFSLGYLFNPLNCSSCVQKVILTLFFPDVKTYLYSNEISLLSHLGEGTSHTLFQVVGIALVALTFYLVGRKIIEVFAVTRLLRSMERTCVPSQRLVENLILAQALHKQRVKIYVSTEIEVPLATYSQAIFIPQFLEDTFSQDEFEAVLAHELEHIRWMDPLLRLFFQLISAVFWWVPTYACRKRLEFDQEIACDQSILRYGYLETSLASAVMKVSARVKGRSSELLCYLTKKKHDSVRRLESMLGAGTQSSRRFEWVSFILIILFSIVVPVCAWLS